MARNTSKSNTSRGAKIPPVTRNSSHRRPIVNAIINAAKTVKGRTRRKKKASVDMDMDIDTDTDMSDMDMDSDMGVGSSDSGSDMDMR
jgi:hypothetical protein